MAKRLRKAVAVAAVSLLCLPLGACGGASISDSPDASGGIAPEGSAAFGFDGVAETNDAPSFSEQIAPVADDPFTEPEKSTEYDGAYIWSGDLTAAGWADTAENKTPAPNGYVLVDNEDVKSISIQNATAFAYFAHEASLIENDGFAGFEVNLDCDIDLGGENKLWIPAALSSRSGAVAEADGKTVAFKGTFNGNGHTIYNFSSKKFYDAINYDGATVSLRVSDSLSIPLPVDNGGEYLYGLFATAGNATIVGLNVIDIDINLATKTISGTSFVADSVGGVVAYVAGDCTIHNVTVGSAGGEEDQGHGNDAIVTGKCAGGIVGSVYAAKMGGKPYGGIAADSGVIPANVRLGEVIVKNCKSYVDLDGESCGGIIGYAAYNSIGSYEDCINYGNIVGLTAGGMTSCYRLNNYTYYADESAGKIDYEFMFENCVNHGDVTEDADATYVGGIIGGIVDGITDAAALYNKTFGLYDCANYGTITMPGLRAAGGIIGRLEIAENVPAACTVAFELNRTSNYGDVIGYDGSESNADISAGGIIGTIASLPDGHKSRLIIGAGNCGAVTGKVSSGTVGKGAALLEKCTVRYLIDAYKKN